MLGSAGPVIRSVSTNLNFAPTKKKGRLVSGPFWVPSKASKPSSYRQDMDGAGRPQPNHVGLADLRVGNLALLCALVLRQMPDDLANVRDASRSQWMALGQEAARNVHRRMSTEIRVASTLGIDELRGFAVSAQAEVLVMHEFRGREAIVKLGQADVLGSNAGLLVRLLGGAPGKGADVGKGQVAVGVRVGGEH